MNPRIEKLKAERDKIAHRIESLTARLKALDDQILKLENTDIIGIVRENGLSLDQLAELMFITPVIQRGVIGEHDRHVCRIVRETGPDRAVFSERMDKTSLLCVQFICFIQAGQQQCEESTVIGKSHLAESSVAVFQSFAETAVISPVDLIFLQFEFFWINDNITEHQLLFLNSVPHFGQRTMILPLPRGILIFCLQDGHRYIWYWLPGRRERVLSGR